MRVFARRLARARFLNVPATTSASSSTPSIASSLARTPAWTPRGARASTSAEGEPANARDAYSESLERRAAAARGVGHKRGEASSERVAATMRADGTAPKTVKIFVNKPNLSFDNCGKKATATLALTAAQVASGEVIELDFTQFQNVRVVSFFVDDNQGGGDVTNVSKIVVNGTPVQTTNMSELKKC